MGVGLAAFLGGFVVFVNTLKRQETQFGRHVDAVIALTGGADRIADALSILAEGRARRLLITGVHPNTTEASLIRHSGNKDLFACCVDIDRQALNTLGNAREASRWAREKGARSLMLVTSSYHMPRALIELRRFSPGAIIVPSPVISESGHPANWRRDPALARLLLIEYVKYLRARLRQWYDPLPALG